MDEQQVRTGTKTGTLGQRDSGFSVLRLRLVAGDADTHFLETVTQVARDFGRGEVHFTTRQGIEIPWVPNDRAERGRQTLEAAGLRMGICGPRVRVVVGCPGSRICRHGIIDTKTIAQRFDEQYVGRVMPHKFKFAVTGCPNNCAKATENDLGVMGAVLPRWKASECSACDLCLAFCPVDAITKADNGSYCLDESRCIHCSSCTTQCPTGAWEVAAKGSMVWLGGTMGKIPRLATPLTGVVEDQEVLFAVLRNAIGFYQREGRPGERLGRTIDRVGMEYVRSQILPNSTSDCVPVE